MFIVSCRDTRIVIWDTINALTEEYIRACTLTRYDRQDVHYYENCHDLIHTGMRAISIGTRLLLNPLVQNTIVGAACWDSRSNTNLCLLLSVCFKLNKTNKNTAIILTEE